MAVRHGVRFRSTVAAVVVVAVGLVAGAVALVALLRAELTDDVRQAARARAEQVAAVIESGRGVPSLVVADRDEQFIQVLDADGDVVAASANVDELPALARPGGDGESRITTPLDEDEFLVVATVADAPDGQKTVLVGRALIAVAEATQIVTRLLLVGLPLLLLLAGAATWMAVGRALAPVAAIRTEVEAISSAQLHRRVPLPRGQDEIAGLAATMNRMLDRLEVAQKAQRRFISDASHELRSPWRPSASMPRSRSPIPAVRRRKGWRRPYLRRICASSIWSTICCCWPAPTSTRCARIMRPVDVDDLVLDEARRLRTAATGLRISTAGVSPARLAADPQGLRRVLRNLGDNAARHARYRVAFDLAEEEGRIVLGVEDDGPGVPAVERERIFERFVRLDDARSRSVEEGGGSGLGLAIVAELVAAHGGAVTVSGSALGGARFEVSLPAREDLV